jgi:SAM-dependent methyltransferase
VFAVRPQRGRIHRVVHESASSGYRKQAVAYHQARPSYHPRMVERFADRYGQGLVVDLGAGTGIFTAQIVAAGVTVIAVEPVGEMRSVLEASLRGVEVRAGTAEALPVGSAGADTVVAAQAFHWFASDQALDEIHRVVRPGGHLVTVWNVWDETVEWVSEYNLILGRYEGDTPRHRTMEWRRAIEADDRFELVDDWAVENLQEMNVRRRRAPGPVDELHRCPLRRGAGACGNTGPTARGASGPRARLPVPQRAASLATSMRPARDGPRRTATPNLGMRVDHRGGPNRRWALPHG